MCLIADTSRPQTDSATPFNYNPHPVDMTNLTLSREMQNMAERLAENAHDIWAKKKKEELVVNGGKIFIDIINIKVSVLNRIVFRAATD